MSPPVSEGRALLADVAVLGRAFAVETGTPAPDPPGWRPLTDLRDDPAALRREADTLLGRLGTAERRVAVTPAGATVARRTCCLVWRLPGTVTCADCVLGAGRRPGGPG